MNSKSFTVFAKSFVISLITLVYIGIAFKRSGRPSNVPIETIMMFVPIAYGLFGVFDDFLTTKFKRDYSLLVGMFVGLVFSLVGSFMLDLPRTIFGFKESTMIVHVYAVILYALIFKYIVHPITR